MQATIDSAGRVVVPKAVRDELGLAAGTVLEITVVDRRIEVEVPPTPMRLEQHEHGAVAIAECPMPALSAELVRDTLERVRR